MTRPVHPARRWALALLLLVALTPSCAAIKKTLRTVDDAASILCELFAQEHPQDFEQLVHTVLPPARAAEAEREGFSPAVLCGLREVLEPFTDQVLQSQQRVSAGITAGSP